LLDEEVGMPRRASILGPSSDDRARRRASWEKRMPEHGAYKAGPRRGKKWSRCKRPQKKWGLPVNDPPRTNLMQTPAANKEQLPRLGKKKSTIQSCSGEAPPLWLAREGRKQSDKLR